MLNLNPEPFCTTDSLHLLLFMGVVDGLQYRVPRLLCSTIEGECCAPCHIIATVPLERSGARTVANPGHLKMSQGSKRSFLLWFRLVTKGLIIYLMFTLRYCTTDVIVWGLRVLWTCSNLTLIVEAMRSRKIASAVCVWATFFLQPRALQSNSTDSAEAWPCAFWGFVNLRSGAESFCSLQKCGLFHRLGSRRSSVMLKCGSRRSSASLHTASSWNSL